MEIQQHRRSVALLTDFYQLTMAYTHWRCGTHVKEAVFNLFFRRNPFGGGFAIACGLNDVISALESWQIDKTDLDFLARVKGPDGAPLFEPAFLEYLGGLRLECDVKGVPEGTVVFPLEPLLRVQGPIVQAQLIETLVLNQLNFPTLIATKAARVCLAAQGEPVLEFGLRRAQGMDGGLTASRAAYVGGCAATSNALAGKLFGIPVRGTHAHSWVMSFESEAEAFHAYARAMPQNAVFLVDTYDSHQGVRNAIEAGRFLRSQGCRLAGIRLDSGDLGALSQWARRALDEAGFQDAFIVASNDLDEHSIEHLKRQGAAIGVWGVGTKLATAYDEPALGGVYKLTAIRQPGRNWRCTQKLSEEAAKGSLPGILQVRRYSRSGQFIADAIINEAQPPAHPVEVVCPSRPDSPFRPPPEAYYEELLAPVFEQGRRVYEPPASEQSRQRTLDQLSRLRPEWKRLTDPEPYPVGLELGLNELRNDLERRNRVRTGAGSIRQA